MASIPRERQLINVLRGKKWNGRPTRGTPTQRLANCLDALDELQEIGGEHTVFELREILNEKICTHPSIRGKVIETLGILGDDNLVEVLLTALKDDVASVREDAVCALGEVQSKKAMPILQQQKVISRLRHLLVVTRDHYEIRQAAIWTLEHFKCEESVTLLEQVALTNENEEISERAHDALFYMEYGYDPD